MGGRWPNGLSVAVFRSESQAAKAIKKNMEARQYWPDVWFQDDHGGFALRSLEEAEDEE
jgi:hypothetical protein